jgi:sterol desaturase/sphingolipid hydroxylase (fatty acid hydroxylase superfamily)
VFEVFIMMRMFLRWTLWPLGLGAFLAGVMYFGDIHDGRTTYGATSRMLLIVLLVFVALELVLPFRADWRFPRDRDLWRNIGHTILYGNFGGLAATYLVFVGIAPLVTKLELPSLWPISLPSVAQIALVLVVGDFFMYWLHRFAHRLPPLWAVHAVHHMPQRINMLMSGRHHILYLPLIGLCVWTPLVLLGAPLDLVIWQFVGIGIAGNIGHANIDFRIPRFMHRVLVTPEYHRLHHSADPQHINANFGVLLPIWDIIFGTFVDPVTNQVSDAGIESDPIPHRFLIELGSPFNLRRWRQDA